MIRKAIMPLLLFSIIVLGPIVSMADDLDTVISADQISINPDNTLQAIGNVFVKQGNVSIRAEAMTVNEEKNQIEFQDIIEFSDGNSLKLTGKNAVLTDDLSSGIITASQVLIDDTIRIRAGEIELKNSTLYRAESIDRITSCKNAK